MCAIERTSLAVNSATRRNDRRPEKSRAGDVDPSEAERMAIALDTLVYARRLREAGFTEQQAEGQAEALAAAMTDSLATKQDLRELEARIDVQFAQIDARFEYLERHLDTRVVELEKRLEIRLAEQERRMETRFGQQAARFGGELADLERRMTLRLGGITVAGIGVVSALVKLL
jgi:hypothetical protein